MSDKQTKPQSTVLLTPEQVASYLSKNPDFFTDYPDVLEQIQIPHSSGIAVSLVTKQLEVLRNKNQKLSQQLDEFVQNARQNDHLFQKMHKLTLALFTSDTLEDTIQNLERVLHEDFLVDFVAVRLTYPDNHAQFPSLFVAPGDESPAPLKKILENMHPFCGQTEPSLSRFLFRTNSREVRSSAIIPLMSPTLSGILAIGSQDEQRFQADMGHIFLKYIGQLVSCRLASFLQKNP